MTDTHFGFERVAEKDKAKRVVEVYVEGHLRVRLTEVIDRGSDHERCGYEMVT